MRLSHGARDVLPGWGVAGLALGFLLLALPAGASAAVKTWDGGCGIDSSWSCAGNWSDNAVPGAEDTVTFNGTSSADSTVDPGFAGVVANLNVAAGYTGTISLSRSLTVSASFSQTSGSFTAAGQALSMTSFKLSGGRFTASSAITSIAGTMTISGSPTFVSNEGTIRFGGTSSATLRCDHVDFNLVELTHTVGTKTVSSDCDLPLGADPSAGGGSVTLNGTLSGSGTLTTGGLLTLGKTGSLSGFSGLVANRLTVSGTYDFGAYAPFAVAGAFKVNEGAGFTAPSGTASFGGAFAVSSKAVFVAGKGILELGGTSGTVACGGKSFNLVELKNTGGTRTVSTDCSLPLGASPSLTSGGSVTLNGTLSGSGTLATGGLLTLGKTGSLSGFSGLKSSTLTVNGAYDFGSYSPFAVSGAFTLGTEASFTAPSGTASFGAGFKLSTGSEFVAGSGTVDFGGEASGTLSCSEASFNRVVFTHTRGNKTVGGSCTLPLGADPTLGASTQASVTLNGALSGSGTLTARPTLTVNSTGRLIGFSGLKLEKDIVISGASLDFGSYGPFDLEGNYKQTGGTVTVPGGAHFAGAFTLGNGATFNAPAGTATFAGKFLLGKGSIFNADGGTIEFSGSANGTITCNNTAFHRVAFAHATGIKTVSADCNLPLGAAPSATSGGSITLFGTLSGSGTLTTGGLLTLGKTGSLSGFSGLSAEGLAVGGAYDFSAYGPFSVSGDFTISTGGNFKAPAGEAHFGGDFVSAPESTFVADGGTVVLDGAGQTVAGDTTFENFRKVVSAPDTLTFAAGDTQTVQGQLELRGKAGNLLSLASSEPGTAWSIDRQGSAEVAFVSVADSHNVGTTIVAEESSDGGGNSGWIFPGPATHFALAAQTTTPTAGAQDNLTITARDALGNTATSYSGAHSLTFGPVADSPSGAHATVTDQSGTATNLGAATPIAFSEGIAAVSGAKNGALTLVKAGATSLTVTDGSISNGTGLPITVSPAAAARIAWANATSNGTLSSPCLFTCTGTGLTATGSFKANVSITDSFGNTVSSLGSGHAVTVTPSSGTVTGGTLTIASTGPAESTTRFTFTPPSKGGASTLTAATSSGAVYTSATASMSR